MNNKEYETTIIDDVRIKERKIKVRKSLNTQTGTHLREEISERVMFTVLYRATGILHNGQHDGPTTVLILIL